jgi:hypothetical protein
MVLGGDYGSELLNSEQFPEHAGSINRLGDRFRYILDQAHIKISISTTPLRRTAHR